MKPLDIVITPKGAIAVVARVYEPQNGSPKRCGIEFINGQNPTAEKNAWWTEADGLRIIDSIPNLLARVRNVPLRDSEFDAQHNWPIVDQ